MADIQTFRGPSESRRTERSRSTAAALESVGRGVQGRAARPERPAEAAQAHPEFRRRRQRPRAEGTEGADAAVEVGDKHVSIGYEGDSKAMAFDGAQLHGRCFRYQVDGKHRESVRVPPDKPRIITPRRAFGPSARRSCS